MEWQERGPDRLGYTERDFKVCDLCGALNPATNVVCFVCGWNGMFYTDRETVGDAMRDMEREYGGLNQSLFEDEAVTKQSSEGEFLGRSLGVFPKAVQPG